MLDIVIEARKASIGHGLDVRRILPFRLRRMDKREYIWQLYPATLILNGRHFSQMRIKKAAQLLDSLLIKG